MRRLILFFFLSLASSCFSQLKDQLRDTLEAKKFWADNIQNIIEFDQEKILDQTHFPLIINDERFTEEQFKPELTKHFNPKVRSELKRVSFSRLKAWYIGDDVTPTYMIICFDGIEKQFFSVGFIFFQFDGEWKLKEITYL